MALFGALAVGVVAARSPVVVVATLVGLGLVAVTFRPAAAVALFGFLAFASGWFLAANKTGFLITPNHLATASTGAIIVGAAFIAMRPKPLVNPRISAAIVMQAFGVLAAVVLGIVHTRSLVVAWDGSKALVLVLVPLALMSLLADKSRVAKGLTILIALYVGQAIYALVQYSNLSFLPANTWFTVGDLHRWWDSRAIFGTFYTGNKSFGNAMALVGSVFLAIANSRSTSSRTRWVLYSLYATAVPLVILSLARSALVSLVVGSFAAIPVRRLPRAAAAMILIGPIIILTVGWSSLLGGFNRGVVDDSAQTRIQIWKTIAHNVDTDLLVGKGYGSATGVNLRLGLGGIGISSDPSTAPPTENLFLRQTVEGGVIGIASLVGFFSLLLAESMRPDVTRSTGAWRRALRGLTVTMIIQSFTSDTLFFEQSSAVFALLLGIVGAGITVYEREETAVQETRVRSTIGFPGKPAQVEVVG